MKCPICGQELRPGKKDPNYLLCYNCKKKYKVPQNSTSKQEEKPVKSTAPKKAAKKRKIHEEEEEEQT